VSGDPKQIVSVRFPPPLEAAAKAVAARDGMNVSEWLRKIVYDEISRRGGICPACGQEIPEGHGAETGDGGAAS
jgi:hypothetical protein